MGLKWSGVSLHLSPVPSPPACARGGGGVGVLAQALPTLSVPKGLQDVAHQCAVPPGRAATTKTACRLGAAYDGGGGRRRRRRASDACGERQGLTLQLPLLLPLRLAIGVGHGRGRVGGKGYYA